MSSRTSPELQNPPRPQAMRRSWWVLVREAALERKLDRFVTQDRVLRAAAAAKPLKPPVFATVTLKVQVWDGNMPMTPLIVLEHVPKQLQIYNHPGIAPSEQPAREGGGLGDVELGAPFVGVPGAVERRIRSLADPRALASTSLLREVSTHSSFGQIVRRAQHRRSAKLAPLGPRLQLRDESALPFFFLGRQIVRTTADESRRCHAPGGLRVLSVKDVMRLSPRFGVGWTEATLDLALNREADLHLASRKYDADYTFSCRVEAVELARPATEEAPFGLAPSTYVSIEHGRTLRFSHIERETRLPNFSWLAGSIPYETDEPLKIRVFMAKRQAIQPRTDTLIGQM